MNLSNLTENDLFGRFYLKLPGNARFDNYFETIDALRPFLNSKEWKNSVTGYYINVAGNMDTVRLSYFTANPLNVAECINLLCANSAITQSQEQELPHERIISKEYGNEELRFRKYLYIYALIGLDILKADLLYSRRLMATFRLQIMISRQSCKNHFQKTFEKHSPAYNNLSSEQKEQFWQDLSNWPIPRQVDWAHMMVNMLLPGDFTANWKDFIIPRPALSISQVNDAVKNLNFTIPDNWQPLT